MNGLWFPRPAAVWNEALPLGNGRLAAMLYGGLDGDPGGERLDLNEGTLWSGTPGDDLNDEARRFLAPARALLAQGRWHEAQALIEGGMTGHIGEAYQPLGTLRVERAGGGGQAEEYRRQLDLETAVHTVQCGPERRETFISAPDGLLVSRWSGLDPAATYRISLDSPHPARLTTHGGGLHLHLRLPSRVLDDFGHPYPHPEPVRYEPEYGLEADALLRVLAPPGCCRVEAGPEGAVRLRVQGTDHFTLLFTAASSFRGWNVVPLPGDPAPLARCVEVLDRAANLGDTALLERHVQEYTALFGRVRLDLGGQDRRAVPTDERRRAYQNGQPDPDLERLLFDYGRSLLISASRPGGQPATLQGLWNPHVQPPWHSDYTININTQMNYWPAEMCGLEACLEPLEVMLHELAASGARTARVHYGAGGWAAHHNTDLWRKSTPTGGSASWAFWPLGGAWLARQLWEGQLFRPDLSRLQRHWPVLAGAARFLLDWLVEQPSGALGVSPSTSPENTFLDAAGRVCAVGVNSAVDLQLTRDLLQIAVEAVDLLEAGGLSEGDRTLRAEAQAALVRLVPVAVQGGTIPDWPHGLPEAEPGHRHFSPLYGLYPAHLFDPAQREAARETLRRRLAAGSGHTGWSAAWAACLFARLQDAEAAHGLLRRLIAHSTLPNLLGDHPPFQIDANFGGTAAVAELLLQSHAGEVHLLPALPAAWPRGRVRGLRARGGITVDMYWQGGRLDQATLTVQTPTTLTLRYGDLRRSLDLGPGTHAFGPDLEPTIPPPTENTPS